MREMDGSAGKMLAIQTCGPMFKPQNLPKKGQVWQFTFVITMLDWVK